MSNTQINTIDLILPWPPSVNSIWRTTTKGNWYMTKVAKDFKHEVFALVCQQKARNAYTIDVPLELIIIAHPPDNRRRDLDNLVKICSDSLQDASVFEDDCQIKKLYMEMKDIYTGGKLLVSINRI